MDNSQDDIGFLIKVISDNLLKKANQLMADFDLTFQQLQIIEYVNNQSKEVNQKDIERHLNVAHPTVVGLLKRMEVKNFLVCKFSENDKRIKNVYLTEKAYNILKEVKGKKAEMENRVCRGLDENQRAFLISSLQTLFKNTNS